MCQPAQAESLVIELLQAHLDAVALQIKPSVQPKSVSGAPGCMAAVCTPAA